MNVNRLASLVLVLVITSLTLGCSASNPNHIPTPSPTTSIERHVTPNLASATKVTHTFANTVQPTRAISPMEARPSPSPTATLTPTSTPTTAPASPTTSPTPTELRAITPGAKPTAQGIKAEIQKVVNTYFRAVNDDNFYLFDSTLDSTDQEYMDYQHNLYYTLVGDESTGKLSGKVRNVEPMKYGFYRVTVYVSATYGPSDTEDIGVVDMLFRKANGQWKLSEPTAKQLGKVHKLAGKDVTVEYYDWDAYQVGRILTRSQSAFERVSNLLDIHPKDNVRVRLMPSFSVSPNHHPDTAVGFYLGAYPNKIYMFSPGSIGFGSYDYPDDQYYLFSQTVTHELSHLLADRKISIQGLPDWMTEGLAQWISADERTYLVDDALKHDKLLNLLSMEDFYLLDAQEQDLAYYESYEVVDYIIYLKGIDGYWKLADAYKQTHQENLSLKRVLGMNLRQFERSWRQWLRQKYEYMYD